MPLDKTWPWAKSKLNVETHARFEQVKFKNGVESGATVLANGTFKAGAVFINGYHWVEDADVVGAFNFSSLLNQGTGSTNKLYIQYTYTDTDPHATAVFGYAATLPSNAIQLGTITVPASTTSITQGMIDCTDSNRDLANKYLSEHAIPDYDTRIPTQDEKNAMAGGSPGTSNRFATLNDLSPGGGDNLGNHTATQDINFANFKGVSCSAPTNPNDVANRQFVLDNIGGQNLASSVAQLRKHTQELQLLIDGMTNSPYPDNFGQPFFRTEFEEIGSYVEIDGKQTLQSDHDLTKLTADVITRKRAERGCIDTRLQLPKQYYFGEVIRYNQIPDIANKPHCITYAPDDKKIYMITRGDSVDDTVLHRINLISLQIEASWFFEENTFTRWNGIASGISFGAGQLFISEYDTVNKDAVCMRFKLSALPPQGIRITKSNVGAIESAGFTGGVNGDIFTDIAHDPSLNILWGMRKTGASNHKLVRLKTDFVENGVLQYDATTVNTSSIDASVNGIDCDGDFIWFVGDTWTGRMSKSAVINTQWKSYGKTGICRVTDNGLPSVDGQVFNTDKTDVKMWALATKNTNSLPASASYRPVHAVASISSVDNITKVVTLQRIDGTSPTFEVNEFKGFHMRLANVYWNIASNTATTITLETQLDISGLSGTVELGAPRRNFATTITTNGTKMWAYEGGADNVTVTSIGFMLDKDTTIGAVGIELGSITTQGNIELRVETNNNGSPSGTLVHANATTTIASGSLVASSWNAKAFTNTFNLIKNTLYHVKIINSATCQVKGHATSFNKFDLQASALNVRLYNGAKLDVDVISDVATSNNRLYIAYKQAAGSIEVKPDGASGLDTYIDEANPAENYSAEALMKIACNEGNTGTPDTWASLIPTGRRYFPAVVSGGKLYISGGYSGTSRLNDLWECDLTTFIWTQKANMPTARSGHSAVVNGGKMYIFGGWDDASYLNELWECDLTTFVWTQKTSGATGRHHHSAIVNGGKMYVFGGENPGFPSDLWECDLTTFVWTQKTSGATGRGYHSAVVNGGKMYVFGGYDGTSFLNDLWECDLITFVWVQKTSGATARHAHTSVVNGGKMYVFGGSGSGSVLNDLWECDLTTFVWVQKTSGATTRRYHSAIVNGGKMYVFGGGDSGSYLNDLWECDLTTFVWVQKTDGATGRHYHSAIVNGGKMYVFGGYNGTSLFNDLWECDLTTFVWVQKTSGATARYAHTSVVNGGKMYVFGGTNGSSRLNDLWECDLTTFVWVQKTSGATARTVPSAVVNGGKMYVFGGYSGGTSYLNDLWECDLATFVWAQKTSGATTRFAHTSVVNGGKMYVFGGYVEGPSFNDLWECDLTTFVWTQKTSGATARHAHTSVVNGGKMYVFGGYNGTSLLNDLWECDLTTFVWTQKTSGATARDYHSAIVNGGKMYVFGGYSGGTSYLNDLREYVIVATGGGVSKMRSIIKFDLSSVPANAVTAILALYLSSADASSKTISLHKLTESPTASQATWNNRATGTAWTTVGGVYASTPVASKVVANSAGYVEFDITNLYNEWKAGTTQNYGLIIRLNDEVTTGIYVYLASSDEADEAKRPKLAVSANPTSSNIGVLTRDKLVSVGYGGSITQAVNVLDDTLLVGLSNEVRIMDVSDNTVLQVINNSSFPGITSTVINDIVTKKLIADEFTQKVHNILVVACNNGVTVINMTTGTSHAIRNYELESNGATCKRVAVADNGELVIVTETGTSGVYQIDIFGDVTKIYTSNTNKTWEQQTGFRKTLKGPTNSGVLPSNTVKAVAVRTTVDNLLGYTGNLLVIANGSSVVEYDVKTEKVKTIDTVAGMTCYDVAYYQDTINAIFSDGSTDGLYKQYDTYLRRLNYSIGKSTSANSRLNFESWNLLKLRILDNKVVVITTDKGVEIIDLTYRDTNHFGDAVWYSGLLDDPNGISRATVMIKGIKMPKELMALASNASKGEGSVSVNFGDLGALVSAGDTIYLYSTSDTSAGNGEKLLVASNYNETSATIPFASTTLNENIDESSIVLEMASQTVVDSLPVRGVIKIDLEEMLYNGKSAKNLLVEARGINGTTPVAHNIGATVQTVLRFDYMAGDEVVCVVNKKKVDKIVDVRVTESSNGASFDEGNQVVISDLATGYYTEAVRSDYRFGQLKLGLKRTNYVGDTASVDSASIYWENY